MHPAPSEAGLLPPHDVGAEEGLISAIILRVGILDEVIDLVRPEHFYVDRNGLIYGAIAKLAVRGKPIDEVLLAGALEDAGQLQRIGGRAGLTEIVCLSPAVHSARALAERIVDLATRRLMIAAGRRWIAIGYSAEGLANTAYCDEFARDMQLAASVGARSHAAGLDVAMQEGMAELEEQASREGPVVGMSTGFTQIDKFTGGLHTGDVLLLCGVRKMAKSSLSRQLCVNIGKTPRRTDPDGAHVFAASFVQSMEMNRKEVALAMACAYGGVDLMRFRTKTQDREDWRRITAASIWLSKVPIKIHQDRGSTLTQLKAELRIYRAELAKGVPCPLPAPADCPLLKDCPRRQEAAGPCSSCCGRAACRAELGIVVVDTIQVLAKNEPGLEDETDAQRLDRIGRTLGDIAVTFQVAVIAISHLNKGGATFGAPSLEGHAQSKWVTKWSEKKAAPTYSANDTTAPHDADLKIEFQRFGPPTHVPLWYRPAYTRWEEDTW